MLVPVIFSTFHFFFRRFIFLFLFIFKIQNECNCSTANGNNYYIAFVMSWLMPILIAMRTRPACFFTVRICWICLSWCGSAGEYFLVNLSQLLNKHILFGYQFLLGFLCCYDIHNEQYNEFHQHFKFIIRNIHKIK